MNPVAAARVLALVLASTACGLAAPILRLSTSAAVVQVAVGTPETSTQVEYCNTGVGTLSPIVSIERSADWLSVAVTPQSITASGQAPIPCGKFDFALRTGSFARGTYTAQVTVSAANAIDAPQYLTVTVNVGKFRPIQVEEYMNPGSSKQLLLNLPAPKTSLVDLTPSTDSGGQWFAVVVDRRGTLPMLWTYWLRLTPPGQMPNGTYSGKLTIGNSTDDGAIPVTMHVTDGPIAVPSPSRIDLRLEEGGPEATIPFVPYISLTNGGLGALHVSGVSASGPGIDAKVDGDLTVVSINPATLAPGHYNDGSVTIFCNAANCPIRVPVAFEILPLGRPEIYPGSVADSGIVPSYETPEIVPGGLARVRGARLTNGPPKIATGILPTNLDGVLLLVNRTPAHLFYVSAGEIGFQVPSGTKSGTALVQVLRRRQAGNQVQVNVVSSSPQIVSVTGIDGSPRDATHPAKRGEQLIILVTGLGPANPPVPDGVPSPSNQSGPSVSVKWNFIQSATAPTVLSAGNIGLYEVRTAVPQSLQPKNNYLGIESSRSMTILVE